MNFSKLTFFFAALVALFYLTEAGIGPTVGPCMLSCHDNYVCDRYTVDVVYAIVNDRCLVFQNICFLKKFNCKRINQCLPSVPQTTYRGCYSACQFTCNVAESLGVCATFYDASQLLGTKISFASKCEADKYACQNRVAYTEITTGLCP